jgi:glycosyltransferase involved in cell wall biosynthesis
MKIAIDISQIIYGTGVSVYTRNLVENLIKLYPNVDFLLFGGSLRRKAELDQFIKRQHSAGKTFYLPPKFLDLLWNSFHVFSVEKLIGTVDLIHTSDWTEPPSKIPKVTTIHDLIPLKYPETTTLGIKYAHKKKLAWVKEESSAITVPSQSTKKDLIELLKIEPEKITVTYEGVEKLFQPQSPDVVKRNKIKYQLDGDYLFSLGTLEPRKNLKRLISAFSLVRKKYPNLQLIIGGGSGWGEHLKPQPGIILSGFIPHADLPGLYSGSLAFVFPSLYEGFGLPALEAMACGCPVVSSNVSSLPEVVGKAGILVNPENVEEITLGIFEAIEKRSELSEKGLERAKIFSWEETARLTFSVYQKILAL